MKKQNHNGIGPKVAAARKRAGLSQSALARAAGVAPSLISRLETGTRADLSLSNLYRIAAGLQMHARELV